MTPVKTTKTCRICGEAYQGWPRNQTCSPACRQQLVERRARRVEREQRAEREEARLDAKFIPRSIPKLGNAAHGIPPVDRDALVDINDNITGHHYNLAERRLGDGKNYTLVTCHVLTNDLILFDRLANQGWCKGNRSYAMAMAFHEWLAKIAAETELFKRVAGQGVHAE